MWCLLGLGLNLAAARAVLVLPVRRLQRALVNKWDFNLFFLDKVAVSDGWKAATACRVGVKRREMWQRDDNGLDLHRCVVEAKNSKIYKVILFRESFLWLCFTAHECIVRRKVGRQEGPAAEMLCGLHGNRKIRLMGAVVLTAIRHTKPQQKKAGFSRNVAFCSFETFSEAVSEFRSRD